MLQLDSFLKIIIYKIEAVAPHHAPDMIYDRLLESLARNLLHYDASYDAAYHHPVADNVSWLGFTHGVTFANAVRSECTSVPQLWPSGLLQMACFIGRNRRYLDLTLPETAWEVADTDLFFNEVHEGFVDKQLRCLTHGLKGLRPHERATVAGRSPSAVYDTGHPEVLINARQ